MFFGSLVRKWKNIKKMFEKYLRNSMFLHVI